MAFPALADDEYDQTSRDFTPREYSSHINTDKIYGRDYRIFLDFATEERILGESDEWELRFAVAERARSS